MARSNRTHTRRTTEQWQTIIDDQRDSGLSQQRYCQHNGISVSSFSNAKARPASVASMPSRDTSSPAEDFIPLSTTMPGSSSTVELQIDLPFGIVVQIRQS